MAKQGSFGAGYCAVCGGSLFPAEEKNGRCDYCQGAILLLDGEPVGIPARDRLATPKQIREFTQDDKDE